MIQQQFGVKYHPAHCSRLLRNLKWSQQKPIEKATQRDEEAIRIWKEARFDELKSKAKAQGQTIVFVDESGFYLLPMTLRHNILYIFGQFLWSEVRSILSLIPDGGFA